MIYDLWFSCHSTYFFHCRGLRAQRSALHLRGSNRVGVSLGVAWERTDMQKTMAGGNQMNKSMAMEVPTMCKAYFLGQCKGIWHQNMVFHTWYLYFRVLKFPMNKRENLRYLEKELETWDHWEKDIFRIKWLNLIHLWGIIMFSVNIWRLYTCLVFHSLQGYPILTHTGTRNSA